VAADSQVLRRYGFIQMQSGIKLDEFAALARDASYSAELEL
jgi:hypothetical protein